MENVEDIYPLSPLQEGMLFHTLKEPGTGIYVTQYTCRLSGNLDLELFQRSWESVVQRHQSLRTAFFWEELDEPLQVVRREVDLDWKTEQLEKRSDSEFAEWLETFLHDDRVCGFDPDRAPLMRFRLFRIKEHTYQWVWSLHHMLCDGWSTTVVLREVWELYHALCRGENLKDHAANPFRDYIAWLQKQDLSEAEHFWKEQLKNISSPTPLVTQRLQRDDKGQSHKELVLSSQATAGLRSSAQKQRLTLNTMIQGAWALLLHRYTGEEDILFGTTVSGRPASLEGVEGMVGLFINTLPVRVTVEPTDSLSNWLVKLQGKQIEAREFEYTPLLKVHEWSELPLGVPLFQSLFVFENMPVDNAAESLPSEIEISDVSYRDQSNYPLVLLALPGPRLRLVAVYDRSLFDEGSISRLLNHVEILLQSFAARPDQLIRDLPILTEMEQKLVIEWCGTTGKNLPAKPVLKLIEEQALQEPEKGAVVYGNERLSYDELNRRANQLANYLSDNEAGPGTIVGIYIDRSIEMITAILAVLKSGAAYVPLDPSYPMERIAYMIDDADIQTVLTHHELEQELQTAQLKVIVIDDDKHGISQLSDSNPEESANPDGIAYIIYTSGSTGNPKGVMISHGNLAHSTGARIGYYGNVPERFMLLSSISFDSSVAGIYGTLCRGGCLFIPDRKQFRDVNHIAGMIAENFITHLLSIPSLYDQLLQYHAKMLVSLQTVVVAGEACTPDLVACHRDTLPEAQLFNEYGPTEATVWSTVFDCSRQYSTVTVPIGRPIENTQVYVLDGDLRQVPPGIPGELYLGGSGISLGYLNRPDLTAERFIPNPFNKNGEGVLYKTGDIVCFLDDGNLEFLGRNDEQVKVRGYRIETGEIQNTLLTYPEVRQVEVLVTGAPDRLMLNSSSPEGQNVEGMANNIFAQGDDRAGQIAEVENSSATEQTGFVEGLTAFIVPNQGQTINTGTLQESLSKSLPEYMIPSSFIVLDSLPLSPNGKVDRQKLSLYSKEQAADNTARVEPKNSVETALQHIWQDLLHRKQIGVTENFFHLGGHSLMATQLVSRINSVFQVQMPLMVIFEKPTIRSLSEYIESVRVDDSGFTGSCIKAVSRDSDLPLSFSQQRLWFLDQMEADSSPYDEMLAMRLTGELNQEALEQSFKELINRHEILRTTFSVQDEQTIQKIVSEATFTLQQIDLGTEAGKQKEREVMRAVSEESFDLSSGPLLKAVLVKEGKEEHVLLLKIHHIIFDRWSAGILFREISMLYNSFLKGGLSPLKELPVQYADFSVWQREWMSGETLEKQLTYWMEELKGMNTLELPVDHPRPKVQTFRGGSHQFKLSGELVESLKGLSRNEGVTLFMTLLAAFQCLLHRYTGQDDIVVGSPISNRNYVELEGLIGLFVNTLVMRTDTSGNPVFRELLQKVKKKLLGAYEHQDLPFEKLVEAIKPERDLSRTPLFQVTFALQNVPYSTPELSGLTLEHIDIEYTRVKFDLEVYLDELEDGVQVLFVYNTDLFEPATIERLSQHYRVMLEGIVSDPERTLSELPMLTELEQHQLLVEWNDTGKDYPADKSVHQLFEEQVERTPDAVALICGNRNLSYGELNRRANQVAHYLMVLGVRSGTMVSICMERSIEMVVGILGILKTGAAYVPLDPSYPAERLFFMMEDCRTPMLLTQKSVLNSLPENRTRIICLDDDWEIMSEQSTENIKSNVVPDDLAYVMYTSGSTGKPKGVEVPHRGITRLVTGQDYLRFDAGQRFLLLAPISFDASTFELWGALLHGALCVVYTERYPSVALLGDIIKQHSISTLWLTSSYFNTIIDEAPKILAPVKQLITGGESLSATHIQKAMEILPHVYLVNGYGPTESTTFTCCYDISGSLKLPVLSIPIGKPISNTRVYLLDKHMRPVPVGVYGEIYIGGDGLALGYHNRPELTAEKFVANPFSDKSRARLYRTGDLARYLPDGNIDFSGRIDHQLKVRGFRIEPGEIEAVLGQHDGVGEAIVIAREDHPGDKRLIAFVVPNEMSGITTKQLRSDLKERLPDYMVPSFFVMLDSLPMTTSGKVDRKALPEPGLERTDLEEQFVAPRNELEKQLVRVWEKVLGIEQVGIRDNFFDLGGHSLLTVKLIAEVKKATGKDLTVIAVFKAPTIEQMAGAILKEGMPEISSSVIPIQSHGSRMPLFWTSGSFFMRHLEPDQPAYILISWEEHGFLPVFSTVEEIATHCIERLLAEQPEGPYMLGGYCFFGAIALEMARQLKKQGHEVPLLFLVDTSFRYLRNSARNHDPPGNDYTFKSRIIHHTDILNRLENTGKIAYMFKKIPPAVSWIKRKTVDRVISRIKIAVCRTILFFGHPVPRPLVSFYVWNLYADQLANNYAYQGYTGRVILFNSDRTDWSCHRDWLDLVEGEVTVHVVPEADHLGMIKEPYVGIWAKLMSKYLKEIQKKRSDRAL